MCTLENFHIHIHMHILNKYIHTPMWTAVHVLLPIFIPRVLFYHTYGTCNVHMCWCTSQSSTYVYYHAYVCYVCVECTYVHCVHCTYRIGIQIQRHTQVSNVRLYDSIPLSPVVFQRFVPNLSTFVIRAYSNVGFYHFQHARSNVHVNYIPWVCACVYVCVYVGQRMQKKKNRETERTGEKRKRKISYTETDYYCCCVSTRNANKLNC